jgi:uncharacterized protein YbjT (DUF2867 family)
LPAGFPIRTLKARGATGLSVSSVAPGAGLETPALTEAEPGGHVTVRAVTAFERSPALRKTVEPTTTCALAEAAARTIAAAAAPMAHLRICRSFPSRPYNTTDRTIDRVILVTGGTGFIGPRIVHALRERDRPVRALVRRPAHRSAATLAAWGTELVAGDMTDRESVRRAADGCEIVVHLVAIRQGREEQFRRVMEEGTRDLVAAAQEAGVRRFVLMSALGTSEETRNLVPYYHAKWEQEETVRASGLEHVIFRPSFVFARDGGILPTFRRLARLSPVTPIIGSGEQRLQPIWIEDVAAHFAEGVVRAEVANRTFEIGGPDAVTWNELWERLKRSLGLRRPSVHVPVRLMRINALVTERLPGNIPLTRDLLTMLEHGDNVVTNDDAARTFRLPLVPLDEQLRRAT